MKFIKNFVMCFIIVLTFITSGCEQKQSNVFTVKADSIVNKVVNKSENLSSYYAEGKSDFYINGKLSSSQQIKEWYCKDDKKKREEVTSKDGFKSVFVFDGKKIMLYDSKNNLANVSKDINVIKINSKNKVEEVMETLNGLQKTHNISIVGKENINGFETYHIKAIPKGVSTFKNGNYDYWIDEKSLFPVKYVMQSKNMKLEENYTKIDFSPKYTEDFFSTEIPKGAKVKNINTEDKEENITINEASNILGKPLLYYDKKDGVELREVEIEGPKNDKSSITENYTKDNVMYFKITVVKGKDGEDMKANSSHGEKLIVLRGKKCVELNDKEIKMLRFCDNGIDYIVYIVNPSTNIEDVKSIIEKMIYTK